MTVRVNTIIGEYPEKKIVLNCIYVPTDTGFILTDANGNILTGNIDENTETDLTGI